MLMSVLFAMFLSFNVAFATDNNDKKEVTTTEKAATEVVVKETEKPEGLYCKVVTPEGFELSCWLCSCKDLASAVTN